MTNHTGDRPVSDSLETIVGRLEERVANNDKNMEKGFKSLSDQFTDLRVELKRDLAESQKRFDEDHQKRCPGKRAMRILRRERAAKSAPPAPATPAPVAVPVVDPVGWGNIKILIGSLVGLGIVLGAAYREYSKDPEPRPAISAPAASPGGSGRQP